MFVLQLPIHVDPILGESLGIIIMPQKCRYKNDVNLALLYVR